MPNAVLKNFSFSSLQVDWPDLPVVARRKEIADAIIRHPVVIVCGETGSGKTTQLPKICLEIGRGHHALIGHTQPRRLAARTVAQRIADELHTPLGDLVGYKIRFNDQTRRETRIKLMTDGVLLNETQTDRDLRRYDTLIIDEAHERSLNIDFLLGYLKRLVYRRRDLKLILTSATIDPDRFSRHFNSAPIIQVSGRTFPVETRYLPLDQSEAWASADAISSDAEFQKDDADLTQVEAITRAAEQLAGEDRGDILIFLPTERDIRETADALAQVDRLRADILPLYSRLSAADQLKVFRPDGKRRRIILSTNVAETSVTVPGIHCVIDTGLARLSRYSTRTKVQRLPIEPISQASADQRQGRCGRVAPGVCVRLYSEKDYLERPRYTDPEILRTNLAAVILQMMWLRLGKIEQFPFLDPPDYRQIRDGLMTLHEIGAIDEADNLTAIGKRLAKLPVDPRVGRMIVGGQDEQCLDEVLVIAAALSTQDVRERPSDQQDAADQAHAKFRDDQSDFISLLKLWRAMRQKQSELSNSQFRKWCRSNFLSYLRYREWTDVQQQLADMLERNSHHQRAAFHTQEDGDPFPPQKRDAIHRALLGGLLSNVAMKADAASYTGARGTKLGIWPGSALFKSRPPWIASAELIETTKLYSRTVAPIRVEWIERAAKHLVKKTYTEPHWVAQTAHVHAFEKVTLFGLLLVPRRSVHFGPIDPVQSRQLFIQHALVLNEFRMDHPLLLANRARVAEIERWQEKLRRRDLLSDAATRYAFFDKHIPAHVFSGPTFEQWAKRGQGSGTHELELSDAELFRVGWALPTLPSYGGQCPPYAEIRRHLDAEFPDRLDLQGTKLPLEYHFEPGDDIDGVTTITPLTALSILPDARAEWLVPGVVREKIDALIRSLPKKLRTLFVPVNQAVDTVAQRLPPFGNGSLLDHVAGILWKISGEPVTRNDFQIDQIPPHVLLNVRVIGGAGEALAEGRDLGELRIKLGQQAQATFTSLADPRFTREDLRAWNFGDLPEHVAIEAHGAKLFGYPTLIENADRVQLRLLDSQEVSAELMPAGLRRLFMIETQRELKTTLRDLPKLESLRLNYRPFGTGDELMQDVSRVVADRAFFAGGDSPIRTREAFAARAHAAWGRLYETSRQIGRLLEEILDRYRTLATLLHREYPPLLLDNVEDMRQQFKRLLPKRFLSALPGERLEQLPRYLRGIDVRLTKLMNAGLSRDLSAAAVLRPLQQQFDAAERRAAMRGLHDPALTEYRWMLEELRISLFAQELKTPLQVSPKRLEQAWQRVRRV